MTAAGPRRVDAGLGLGTLSLRATRPLTLPPGAARPRPPSPPQPLGTGLAADPRAS